MKVALVIGHKQTSQGAENSKYNITEFTFNKRLVRKVIENYEGDLELVEVYRRSYQGLPEKLNNLNPDFIISFHANAYNEQASGTSTLYYHKSNKGKTIARIIQNNVVLSLGLRNRGIRPKTSEDKGGYLLRYTKAPIVIVEPFFIDNNTDCYIVLNKFENLVDAYIKSLEEIEAFLTKARNLKILNATYG